MPRQIASLEDQSDGRGRSQMTTRLVAEPVQRVRLVDDVSPTSKRLLELLEAGHAKQFHMAAAVRGGSQLDDVELLGGFDPGCSVDGSALAPVKPEVTLRECIRETSERAKSDSDRWQVRASGYEPGSAAASGSSASGSGGR
jgi:hypothetical protein